MSKEISEEENLRLGIVGCPLNHTKSPQMQDAGLRYLGMNVSYEKFEIQSDDFKTEFPNLLQNVDGINITIPYKEPVVNYLNHVDPLVEKIGAANTVLVKEGMIAGFNTDYFGFMQSIKHLDLKDKEASVMGGGGSAKAVIVALEDMGVKDLVIYVRNKNKPLNLPKTKIPLQIRNFDEVNLTDSVLLVNCTPVGQGRLSDEIPIEPELLHQLEVGATVMDLIYTDTLLLKAARELAYKSINGTDMLVYQGAESLSIWTGREIDDGLIDAMREGFQSTCASA